MDAEGFYPKIGLAFVATLLAIMRLVERYKRRRPAPAIAGRVEIDAGELEHIRRQLKECREDSEYMARQVASLREDCRSWQAKAEAWQSRAELAITEKLTLMERLLKRRGDENL